MVGFHSRAGKLGVCSLWPSLEARPVPGSSSQGLQEAESGPELGGAGSG